MAIHKLKLCETMQTDCGQVCGYHQTTLIPWSDTLKLPGSWFHFPQKSDQYETMKPQATSRCLSQNTHLHCKKHHFVSNRYIYLNQSNIEATQDIYSLQKEVVSVKHHFLSFQVVAITLNDIICFKYIVECRPHPVLCNLVV